MNNNSENIEIADAIDNDLEELLHTGISGLTDAQVHERMIKYGMNSIPERKSNKFLKFLSYFGGAISFLLEIAAIVSAILEDWIDFGILVFVLIINAVIGFSEEAKAESALDALKNTLAPKCRSWRNGHLVEIDSCMLVPGDMIVLRLGDIIPADVRLLGLGATGQVTEGSLQIDQSALTGESLPIKKGKGDIAYASSIVKQGQMLGVVAKTGFHTYIGRAANLINITVDEGHFQKVINRIGNFLIIITVVMVVVLLFINIFHKKQDFKSALKQILILTIAAIPVGLPTVLSVTMAVGASQLAKKQVIVKKLTAIEELASVSILCSDKTGTLTLNQLAFDKPYLAYHESSADNLKGNGILYSEEDILLFAFFASEPGANDAIEMAVRNAAQKNVEILLNSNSGTHSIPGYNVEKFVPFDPVTKFTEATVRDLTSGKLCRYIKGAPQVIIKMCGGNMDAENAVTDFATRGLRSLGVARSIDDEMACFEMVGMISLLDPPRPDSGKTIKECQDLGISVKMITGDQIIIAKEVAQRLGMQRNILDARQLKNSKLSEKDRTNLVIKADGFAQVIPEHKYEVVEILQKEGFLVAMTGDGVNDAPALKKANVGIAVEGCTEAARSAADIVLLAAGLSTIVDGVKTSRAIFQRMRSYALYRIASTIHFLIFFLIFFFITLVVFDFSLPDRLIILIAVMNDAATLVISVDNARISARPDKWRIGQLIFLSFTLGVLLMGISFAHYFVAKDIFKVDENVLQTIMYLQISSSPHFVIFSTRCHGWFWESAPSTLFIMAIGGTQIFAMFMSIYGVNFFQAVPIGWAWGVSILLISLLSVVLLDAVKVAIISSWSFELTAKMWPVKSRTDKLKKRNEKSAIKSRVSLSIAKVRKAISCIWAVKLMNDWIELNSKTRNINGLDVTKDSKDEKNTIFTIEKDAINKNDF